jgi:hypothetical protein
MTTDESGRDIEGFKRARAVAQWELGDAGWATIILDAYLHADDANASEAMTELEERDYA